MTHDRDFDRIARAWLDLMPDEAPDRTLSAVLQAVEAVPQVRPLHAGIRRLFIMSRLVPVGAAAALVAAVGLIALVPRAPGDTVAGSPSAPPSEGATAVPSVSVPPVSEGVRGEWLADSSGIPALGTGQGRVGLSISPDGRIVSVNNFAPGAAFLSSMSQLVDGQFSVVLTGASGGCDAGDRGVYGWTLSADGSELAVTVVTEQCANRGVALGRTWVRSLVGATGGGAGVVDTMSPDFFIRLPDDRYESRTLDDFIEIGGTTGFSLMVFKNPQGFADPCSTDEVRYPYTPGAEAVVAYFEQNDAWTIRVNEPVEIDGRPAIHLVTEASAAYARCPGQELYMYTPKACACYFIAGPGGRDNHYLVDVGGDTFMFVLSGVPDAATEQAIVASIRIPADVPSK